LSANQIIISCVNRWIEAAVIGLELCPFAKSVYRQNRLRCVISESRQTDVLMLDLYQQCKYLIETPEIETTLLIIPFQLQEFSAFNQILDQVDALLEAYGWRGIFQIASFHPKYQFDNTGIDDRENWSNRSPYPILHILRESSVEQALSSHANPDQIPETNIQRLRALNKKEFERIFDQK